jgi:hypothetical protein
MQSLNNLSPKGQRILIGVVTALIAIPLFYVAYNVSTQSNPAQKGTYYDKGSGETVTNNQSPETFGTDGTNITYLGLGTLLEKGITKYQIAAYKDALKTYALTRSPRALEFSITTDTIQTRPGSSPGTQNMSFELRVDRKDTYKAEMRYFNISSIQLTITEKDGDPIYTSKEVDGSTLSEE